MKFFKMTEKERAAFLNTIWNPGDVSEEDEAIWSELADWLVGVHETAITAVDGVETAAEKLKAIGGVLGNKFRQVRQNITDRLEKDEPKVEEKN